MGRGLSRIEALSFFTRKPGDRPVFLRVILRWAKISRQIVHSVLWVEAVNDLNPTSLFGDFAFCFYVFPRGITPI